MNHVVLAVLLEAAALRAQPPAKLAPNGGFEQGAGDRPEGWGFYSWQCAEGWWESTAARSGKRSLGIRGLNGGWFRQLSVSEGLVYTVRFHCRSEGAPTNIALFVREMAGGRATDTILYKPEVSITPDQPGTLVNDDILGGADEKGWVLFEGGDFVPHAGVERVDLLIKIEGNRPDARVLLDDLLVAASEPEAIGPTDRRLADLPGAIVWLDDGNRKIIPDQRPRPSPADPAITICAACGEYECFQIAVTPTEVIERY